MTLPTTSDVPLFWWKKTVHYLWRDNPIIHSEFKYQRWLINESRSGRVWILFAALLIVPSLLLSLLAVGLVLLQPIITPTALFYGILNINLGYGFVVILVANVALYPVVMLITFGLSARSISRERDGKTWDNLRLTDIGERRIVWGKWLASLRALWGDHGMSALLRMGLFAVFIAEFSGINRGLPLSLSDELAYGGLLLVLILLSVLFTALDAMLGVALAMVAILPNYAVRMFTTPLAIAIRLFVSGAAFYIVWQILFAIRDQQYHFIALVSVIALLGYIVLIPLALMGAERLVR